MSSQPHMILPRKSGSPLIKYEAVLPIRPSQDTDSMALGGLDTKNPTLLSFPVYRKRPNKNYYLG